MSHITKGYYLLSLLNFVGTGTDPTTGSSDDSRVTPPNFIIWGYNKGCYSIDITINSLGFVLGLF